MKTPITDAARYRDAYNSPTEDVPADLARRLEQDRAALMDALEELIGDMGAFRRDLGVAFSLKKASAALSAARANFPEQ